MARASAGIHVVLRRVRTRFTSLGIRPQHVPTPDVRKSNSADEGFPAVLETEGEIVPDHLAAVACSRTQDRGTTFTRTDSPLEKASLHRVAG